MMIEAKIIKEMNWLDRASVEIAEFKSYGTPLSEETQQYLAWAVLPVACRVELGKALRLRLRLFGSTRFVTLPGWVMRHVRKMPESLDKRIVERLRADLFRRVGFTDLGVAGGAY
jgi:hypothetical protein